MLLKLNSYRAIIFFAVLAMATFWACQSDTPSVANSTADQNSALARPADNESGASTTDPAQIKAEALARARKLDQQLDQFVLKVQELQTQVAGIPLASKQAASDFPDLEARFDGYMGKGNFFRDEVKKVVQQVSGAGQPFSDESDPLTEITGHLDNLNLAYKDLEAAVEKLKTSKGKRVRLFEE